MYSEEEARRLVVEAGKRLLAAGLVARSWGNVSARISDSEFIITPSGRMYDGLKPEELVKVRIEDLSYDGNIKPSSETGLHAGVYKLRKNAGFVIHTHQHYASAISAEGKDTKFAPCAKYALPGTDALMNNVLLSVAIHTEYNAFLLAKHGTLCIGTDCEDAFAVANKLEEDSKALFDANRKKVSQSKYGKAWLDDYAQLIGVGPLRNKDGTSDDPEAVSMIIEKNNAAAEYVSDAKPLSLADASLQRAVYILKYSKLNRKNK